MKTVTGSLTPLRDVTGRNRESAHNNIPVVTIFAFTEPKFNKQKHIKK